MDAALPKDYFALFGLTPSFDLNVEALRDAYRRVQAQAHPDRYVSGSDQQRRIAVQWAAYINEAFATLRDPVARARYLLQLKGVACDKDSETVRAPEFLMQQMELRERLAEAQGADLRQLRSELDGQLEALGETFQQQWAQGGEVALSAALQTLHRMQFYARLREAALAREEF
jgi:molecular chaperone HscB